MSPKPPSPTNSGRSNGYGAPAPGVPELIVIASPSASLRARTSGPASLTGADVSPLAEVLASAGAVMKPLFAANEDRLNLREAAPGAPPMSHPEGLALYYRVECREEQMDEMAEKLRSLSVIDAAYVKPAPQPATELLNTMLPRVQDLPPVTPDFSASQGYLGPSPGGVEAQHSWTVPGGAGAGVRVIDIEGAWRFSHEDLTQSQGGVVGGTESTELVWRNHGTAVIGVIGGDRNGYGVTGISPDANVRAISIFGQTGSAGAIRRAADLLSPGDIILIELHRPGPLATGAGQQGFIAIEWWPDDYDAIRYAISRGVIVVEAAGNGGQNLDDPAYDVPSVGFPATWRNPFRRGARDSGAILVGAGAPPVGTHGSNHGPDRSRLDFSNYGAAVDAQGWGREVTTCGYGDLQGGISEDAWYTDSFSGTSSASPIVVGSLACIQGVRRARSLAPLTPAAARDLLRSTGSPQQDAPGRPATQRIGNRPNIRQMIARLLPTSQVQTTPLYRYWNPAIGDHFYTTNWNELGRGRIGWRYEGIQCHVYPRQVPGTVPLHRYWNPGVGDHFYTTNFSELRDGARGWSYEGVQCYVRSGAASGSAALYRYWSPTAGDHFYTTDFSELGSGARGYRLEGVQCYVESQPRVVAPVEAPIMGATALSGTPEMPPDAHQHAWPYGTEEYQAQGSFDPLPHPRGIGGGFDRSGDLSPDAPSFVDASGPVTTDSFAITVPDSSRRPAVQDGDRVRTIQRGELGGVTVNIDFGDRRQ